MRMVRLIFVVTLLAALAWQASAMVFDPADFTYVIHLYYDGKKLVPNKDARFQYDVIGENFEQGEVAVSYRGEITSVKGEIIATFLFDPKYVNNKFARGPLDIKAPYFGNAQFIKLYDEASHLLLTVNVGETSVCNQNNICETQVGEDYLSCPSDCKTQIPITPLVSVTPVPATNNGDMILWLILATMILCIVIWLVVRKRNNNKRLKQNNIIPPPAGGTTTPNVPQP